MRANDTVTLETLGAVVARQSVVTNPMRELLENFGPLLYVEVTSRHTPFGTFVLDIVPAH